MRWATTLVILAAAVGAVNASDDDVCADVRALCRPFSYIYDTKRWHYNKFVYDNIPTSTDACRSLKNWVTTAKVFGFIGDQATDQRSVTNDVLSVFTLRAARAWIPGFKDQSWVGFNEILNIFFLSYGRLCGSDTYVQTINGQDVTVSATSIYLKSFPWFGGLMPGYNNVCSATEKGGKIATFVGRVLGPVRYLARVFTGRGSGGWQETMLASCKTNAPPGSTARKIHTVMESVVKLNVKRTKWEPTVGWALNVYVPALITSQQAWLNPKMEEHEEPCVSSLDNDWQLIGPMYGSGGGGAHKKRRRRRLAHAAVQGAGFDASNNTSLPEAASTVSSDEWAHGVPSPPPPQQQQRVRTLCLEDHGGQMIHLGEGSRHECNAHRARRRLLGNGAATDPGVLLVAAGDAPAIVGQDDSHIVLARALNTLNGVMQPFSDIASAIDPVVKPIGTFVGVIGGVYDTAFKPLEGIAAGINPILDGAKAVIDTLTCPCTPRCYRVCFFWCFNCCPCNWLCSLIELALKALDWVWGLIEKVIGGAVEAIFNPILKLAGCHLDGLELSCNVPGLPINALEGLNPLHDAMEGLGDAFKGAVQGLTGGLADVFSASMPAAMDVVADDGSGLFLRMASARDNSSLTIDCSTAGSNVHVPIVRDARRTVSGCAYDYTTYLRFACAAAEALAANVTAGAGYEASAAGCTLAGSLWRSLPYSGCDASAQMADVKASLTNAFGRESVPGADSISVVYYCVDTTRVSLDALPGAVISGATTQGGRRRLLKAANPKHAALLKADMPFVVPQGVESRSSAGGSATKAKEPQRPVVKALPATGHLNVLLERRSRATEFVCPSGDVSVAVVGAEIGRRQRVFDVTPAVAAACAKTPGPSCTLDPKLLAKAVLTLRINTAPLPKKDVHKRRPVRLLRWTGRTHALQARLACLCRAGYSNVITANASTTTGGAFASACVACPKGWYRDATMSSCAPCPPGTFAPTEGSTACMLCGPGTYSDTFGANECFKCPVHTSLATQGATSNASCVACGPTEVASPGSAACTPCAAGSLPNPLATHDPAFTANDDTCAPCRAGTYRSAEMTTCEPCPPGTFSGVGNSSCVPCAPGTYANAMGSAMCWPCPMGSFAEAAGTRMCTACPAGTVTKDVGASATAECRECDTCNVDFRGVADIFRACYADANCTSLSASPTSAPSPPGLRRRVRMLLQGPEGPAIPRWLVPRLDAALAARQKEQTSTSAPLDGSTYNATGPGAPVCRAWLGAVLRDANLAAAAPRRLGDGVCDNAMFNNAACNWDGGDCCAETCHANNTADSGAAADSGGGSDVPKCEPALMECSDPRYAADSSGTGNNAGSGSTVGSAGTDGQATVATRARQQLRGSAATTPDSGGACQMDDDAKAAMTAACPAQPGDPRIGDGHCDADLNVAAAPCAYDGGDCCARTCRPNPLLWVSCGPASSAATSCRDPAHACSG